ncbi:MAG: sensor signal transduction histidine kinase [Thermoleophilia bacterium]|nr:sensor signal transduction histidine kinase [Thermoleophilia bacterium]
MESRAQTRSGASDTEATPRLLHDAVWLVLRLMTLGALWAYSLTFVLALVVDRGSTVSVPVHAALTASVCVITGAAGAVAWNRFRHDGSSQSLLLALSFLSFAAFFVPHILLGVYGTDASNRLLGTLAQVFLPLGLLAVAVGVRVPRSVKSRAVLLIPALVALPFALQSIFRADWFTGIIPIQSEDVLFRIQELSLILQVVATLWLARVWWKSRQPFLLMLAASLGVLASSAAILLWTDLWTPRWWSSHVGDLACAMLLAAGLLGEHRRRGTLLGAFDLNAVSRLAAIVEGSDEAIYSYAKSGTIDSWNRAAEYEYGYSADEAVGRPLRVLVPDELIEEQRVLLNRALQGETIYHTETAHRRKGGAVIEMELTVSPIRTPAGEVVGASVIGHNIAERKRAEQLARQAIAELERADELKSEFLAMASHELRTPLTSIAGFTSTLLERGEKLTEEQRAYFLRIIDQQADRLNRLIGELLTLSKVEAGKLQTNPVPVVVASAITRTVAELDVRVGVRCDEGLMVLSDEDHLQQILVNYLSNAMKYGEPPIFISGRTADGMVEIRVCDHGRGIPPEYVDRLFERFAQLPRDAEENIPSTGLGLSIVRGLARANGGDAWFEPNRDGGACFCVRLPSGMPFSRNGATPN